MAEKYVILPCNGLDKCAGLVTRELALRLHEQGDSEIICPVFYRVSEAKYNRLAAERPLLVIDGCQTRCASKLAAEKNLKIARRIIVADEAKTLHIGLRDDLRITANERIVIDTLFEALSRIEEQAKPSSEHTTASYDFDYETFQNGKFIFRIPKNAEVYFNENDCWAWVNGNRARIGVTDYVQQNLSDILYFYPPETGDEIDQFGELGSIESSKAVFELVSPFGGKVVAINDKLAANPELINENPYELGWVAELELTDPEGDKELLIGFEKYLAITKKKVEDANVR